MSRRARLAVLAAGALFVLGAGAAGWLFTRRAASPPGEYVESRVGDLRLVYQADYARFPGGRVGGRIDTLDIAATFPDLKPAGDVASPLSDGASGQGRSLVFLTIARAERTLDPADLVATLYARFLDADIVETSGGLLKRSFQDGSPYQGEDLYIAPPEGRVFAARCARPTTPPDGLPETCLAAFRESGADVDVRFSSSLLPRWQGLAEGGRSLVRSMLTR